MHIESLQKVLEPEGKQCGEMALEEGKVSPPRQGVLPRPIGVPSRDLENPCASKIVP